MKKRKNRGNAQNSAREEERKESVYFDVSEGEANDNVTYEREKRVVKKPTKKKEPSKLGNTKFFVEGRNGYKVLTAIGKICLVSNVNLTENGVIFDVKSKHAKQVIAILNNLCYNYKTLKVWGFTPFLSNAATRVGLILGIVLVCVMLSVIPMFVTNISVSGLGGIELDNALLTKIDGVLKSYGIEEGKILIKLSESEVEKSLLSLDGVAYAGVKKQGTHVNVEIKRELPKDYVFDVSENAVTSKKVAVVTRVVVYNGTAVKKYGDVVKPGDVLIDGYTDFNGEKIESEANGRVYGKVYHRERQFFKDVETRETFGETKRISKLSMFGKTPKEPKPPFENYLLTVTEYEYSFLIPFKVYVYEYRERTVTEVKNTYTDDEMIKIVYSGIIASIPEPINVLNIYTDIRREADGAYVTVTVESEEEIS